MYDPTYWVRMYPQGVPANVDPDKYRSIVQVFHEACDRFSKRPSFSNMGVTLSFGEVDELSGAVAAFLRRDLGLVKGDRIALQMPNILQYPVALFGALRAGLVVNTNPLYTHREMEHQFRDSGTKAVVILANFARNLQQVLPGLRQNPGLQHAIVTQLGDLFPTAKRMLVNAAVRYIKKMVPAYDLPGAIDFRDALARGRRHGLLPDADVAGQDVAFQQYTGGTTGVSKGAVLTHRNVVANMEQASAWMAPRLNQGEEVILTPLPLYHIFSLTVNCLLFMKFGAENVLITNPRDYKAFVALLKSQPFTVMTVVSTLLNALMNQPGFRDVDLSRVKLAVAGAMALQPPVAERWRELTRAP
jgi:long-chain acyl-CoA synthetase